MKDGSTLRAIVFDYYETLVELSSATRERIFDEVADRVGAKVQPGEAFRHWREGIVGDVTVRLGGKKRPPPYGPPPAFISFRDTWLKRFSDLFRLWGVNQPGDLGAKLYADAHASAPAYSDVRRALTALRGRFRLGLLADADRDFLGAGLDLNGLTFDAVVTSEDVGVYKPHVSMFRAVCEKLDINLSEAVYVGDRPWADIEGARHAGITAVWMNRSGASWPQDLETPPVVATSLDELVDLLAGR